MSIADKLTQVAENTPKVYEAGYQVGYKTGKVESYDEGFIDGQNDGYETGLQDGRANGMQEAYDRFWDAHQKNGSRTDYSNAFAGLGWTNETFKPKYDINSTMCYMMFSRSGITGDLDEILRNCGVSLTLGTASAGYVFSRSQFSALGDIDLKTHSLSYTFESSANLETIRSVNVSKTTKIVSAFTGCTALKNLTLIGPLTVSGLDVSSCPLTHDSLMSIINALQTKTSGTFTVTLGSSNLAKLTDAEKAIATQKGWTLA